MSKPVDPDTILVKMPSLRAVKAFVAAAKYGSFTRAGDALCVSQAAISRQIRELETNLGTPLFIRGARAVELTPAGALFYDAAHLSFVNIAQTAERIRSSQSEAKVLTVCCTPAFSTLWLSDNLPEFLARNEGLELNLITTQNFLTMEPGVQPDAFISKIAHIREGYTSEHLFHDLIYPVCSPQFAKDHPSVHTLEGLRDSALLNHGPYGRSQVAEHVDWGVWFAYQSMDIDHRSSGSPAIFTANDYTLIVTMTLSGQGVALGWHQLVKPLMEQGLLIRPVDEQVQLRNNCHYLACKENSDNKEALRRFQEWILSKMSSS